LFIFFCRTNKRDSIQTTGGLSIVAEDSTTAPLPSPSPLSRQDSGDFSSQISDTSAPATPLAAASTPTQLVESSPLNETAEATSDTVQAVPAVTALEAAPVTDAAVPEPAKIPEPAPVPAKPLPKSKPVPPPRPSAPRPNVKAALEQQASKPAAVSRQDSLKTPQEAEEHERMIKEREQLLKNVELEQQAKLAAKQQADARKEMEERQQEAVSADGKWASAFGTLSSLSGTVLQTLGIDAATVDPIAVVTPVSSVLPEHKWVPDHTTNQCAVCCQEFSLLMRRRHHCRVCGAACCGDCSKTRLPLSLNDTVVYERTCDQCVHKVQMAGMLAIPTFLLISNVLVFNIVSLCHTSRVATDLCSSSCSEAVGRFQNVTGRQQYQCSCAHDALIVISRSPTQCTFGLLHVRFEGSPDGADGRH
jgi:hypothetical protein